MATTIPMQKVLDLAGKFVVSHKGTWDHTAWENFLTKAEKTGIGLDDEAKRNLGNILEATKYFYQQAPPARAKRRSAPRKKPAAKTTARKRA